MMQVFHLPLAGARISVELMEITGGENSVRTTLTLTRTTATLDLTIDAQDPDPLALIATAPSGVNDNYLYEEDCIQVVTAETGQAQLDGLCVVNPLGNRKSIGAAAAWGVTSLRHGKGWSITLRLPLPPDAATMGLGVLRYFRGVHHEVHGIGHPHPIDTAKLAAVVLRADDPKAAAEHHAARAAEAQAAATRDAVAACRARLAAARRGEGPRCSLATARELALARAAQPDNNATGHQCWNESHFQHALLDLWELDQDRRWLDMALSRMERTWSLRNDRRGIADKHWGVPLPTWYDREGDWAMTLISGVILGPITRTIRLIHKTPALKDAWSRVEPWVPLARQVIDLHDREWVELPDGSGNYLEPYAKGPPRVYPTGGSRLCPLNRVFFLTMPMMDLAAVTGDKDYFEKSRKMAMYFKNSCEETPEGGLVWEYLTSRYGADGEDISHAACQVFFAERCAADGLVFTERELKMMARTLDVHIFRHDDVPCETVRGYYPTLNLAVASWSGLTRYVPHVLPKIVAVTEALMAEGQFDFRRQGWGVVSLTRIEKAKRALERDGG